MENLYDGCKGVNKGSTLQYNKDTGTYRIKLGVFGKNTNDSLKSLFVPKLTPNALIKLEKRAESGVLLLTVPEKDAAAYREGFAPYDHVVDYGQGLILQVTRIYVSQTAEGYQLIEGDVTTGGNVFVDIGHLDFKVSFNGTWRRGKSWPPKAGTMNIKEIHSWYVSFE